MDQSFIGRDDRLYCLIIFDFFHELLIQLIFIQSQPTRLGRKLSHQSKISHQVKHFFANDSDIEITGVSKFFSLIFDSCSIIVRTAVQLANMLYPCSVLSRSLFEFFFINSRQSHIDFRFVNQFIVFIVQFT